MTTTHAEDVRALAAQLDAEIEALRGFADRSQEVLKGTNAPANSSQLVQEAVLDPAVDHTNFGTWIKRKIEDVMPTLCDADKTTMIAAFKIAFGVAVTAYLLSQRTYDQEPWGEDAMCDRNTSWPPNESPWITEPSAPLVPPSWWERAREQLGKHQLAEELRRITPRFLSGENAPGGNASVVDEVFTKEAKARERRCCGDARGAR